MPRAVISSFDDWRRTARAWLQADVAPGDAEFVEPGAPAELFETNEPTSDAPSRPFVVPRSFIALARTVACHRDPRRHAVLYRALWRLVRGETNLLDIATDDDVFQLRQMEKPVRRAAHKTKAFVRFRKVEAAGAEQFVAWHRPEHRVLPLVAEFFARRFAAMHWTILTPDESVSWDQRSLTFGPGCPASAAPTGDALEELWKTYYGATFNPARIKQALMKREMPVRHWATLPETRIIPELLNDAPRRVAEMIRHGASVARTAADYLPAEHDLPSLAEAAATCRGCDLHTRATQTVFGRGAASARIVLVGEQPGDQEDLEGRPFIGPAGRLLDEALAQASLTRAELYITNAVKHFHWEPLGKKRLHRKPPVTAVNACRPWLEAEFAGLEPRVLVCLGATAAQAVLPRGSREGRHRGVFFSTTWARHTVVTWHPAAVLRGRTAPDRERMFHELVEHLAAARERAGGA